MRSGACATRDSSALATSDFSPHCPECHSPSGCTLTRHRGFVETFLSCDSPHSLTLFSVPHAKTHAGKYPNIKSFPAPPLIPPALHGFSFTLINPFTLIQPAGILWISTTAYRMAHKHNRRRIRPRSRNHNALVSHSMFDRSLLSRPGMATEAEAPNIRTSGIYPRAVGSRVVNLDPTVKGTNRSQTLYPTWQSRTQRQMEEAAKQEREQIKLFGGVPGDDVGLCYRMLEYFGGLDFIDT